MLSPQRARGQPSGSEREDEEGSRPSVLGKHGMAQGPQSPASAAQQRVKKAKPAARKKATDEKKEKEKNSKKKKNKAKLRENSREKSASQSSSGEELGLGRGAVPDRCTWERGAAIVGDGAIIQRF